MRGTARKAGTLAAAQQAVPPQGQEHLAKQRWSYSRRSVLEQCPRRYYYEYYAGKVAKERQDPRIEHLRRLKSLQNRYERTGAIAHLVIATYLRKAQTGDVWKTNRVVDWARSIFRMDISYSTADPMGMSPREGRFPPSLLYEYFYQHPDAAAVCLAAEGRLLRALRVFLESASLAEFRVAGSQPGACVERNLSLAGLPCRAGGKVDLAFSVGGDVTVVDWKLGDPAGNGEDSLQLAAYALWASHYFAAEADDMKIYKAHLPADEVVQFSVNERVLANARARIMQDAERMAAVHDYGRRGIEEAFTPCAKLKVCALCPFQAICPEGSAVVHA